MLPDAQMDGSSQDVFILDAEISQVFSCFVLGIYRLPVTFLDLYHQHTAAFHQIGLHDVVHFGAAIKSGSRFYHILFFVRTDTGNFPVIFHSDEQFSTVCIGKG